MSHQDPNPTPEKLLEMMADLVIKTLRKNKPKQAVGSADDARKRSTLRTRAVAEIVGQETESIKRSTLIFSPASFKQKQTRYIRAHPRRSTWIDATANCQFTDSKTGRRCGSTHQLEIEHIQPYALDGTNNRENLMLLCSRHNKLRAYQQGFIIPKKPA